MSFLVMKEGSINKINTQEGDSYDVFMYPSQIQIGQAHQQVNVISMDKEIVNQLQQAGFVVNGVLKCPCCQQTRLVEEPLESWLSHSQAGISVFLYLRLTKIMIGILCMLGLVILLMQLYLMARLKRTDITNLLNENDKDDMTQVSGFERFVLGSVYLLIMVVLIGFSVFQQQLVKYVSKKHQPQICKELKLQSRSFIIQGVQPEDNVRDIILERIGREHENELRIEQVVQYRHLKRIQKKCKRLEEFLLGLHRKKFIIQRSHLEVPFLPQSAVPSNSVLVQLADDTPYEILLKVINNQRHFAKSFKYHLFLIYFFTLSFIWYPFITLGIKRMKKLSQVEDKNHRSHPLIIKRAPLPQQIDYMNMNRRNKNTLKYALWFSCLQTFAVIISITMTFLIILFQVIKFLFKQLLPLLGQYIEVKQNFYLALSLFFAILMMILTQTFLKYFELHYNLKQSINKQTFLIRYAKISIFVNIGIMVMFQIIGFSADSENFLDLIKSLFVLAFGCVFSKICTTILDYNWIRQLVTRTFKLTNVSDSTQVPHFQNTVQGLYHPTPFPLLARLTNINQIWYFCCFFLFHSPFCVLIMISCLYFYIQFDMKFGFKRYRIDERYRQYLIQDGLQIQFYGFKLTSYSSWSSVQPFDSVSDVPTYIFLISIFFVCTLYSDEISEIMKSRFTRLDHWFEVKDEQYGSQSDDWLDYKKCYQDYLDKNFNLNALHQTTSQSLSCLKKYS